MSRYIATRAIRGANALVNEAEAMLQKALAETGRTAGGFSQHRLLSADDLRHDRHARSRRWANCRPSWSTPILLHPVPTNKRWTPYLGETLDSGMATLLAAETIEAVRFVNGWSPSRSPASNWPADIFTSPDSGNGNGQKLDGGHLNGPIDDIQLRSWGIQLVDGRMPGFAAIVGCAKSNEVAVKIVRELQSRNILIFLSGNVNGRSIIHQLQEEGVEMGYDTFIVPFGLDTLSAIYALGFATRSALTFGGMKGGQAADILLYNRDRVFAFVLALGEVDDLKYAAAAGAINYGFPVIADTVIPQILPTGVTTYEHVISMPFNEIRGQGRPGARREAGAEVHRSARRQGQGDRSARAGALRLGLRGRGGAQEGHARRVRRQVQPGLRISAHGGHGPGRGRQDRGRRPGLRATLPAQGAMDMGIVIEVAGRKMQNDFEPVLERQIHYFVNGASGIQHIGQRDIAWIRISQAPPTRASTCATSARSCSPLPRRLRRDRRQGAGDDLSPIRRWSPSGWTRPARPTTSATAAWPT